MRWEAQWTLLLFVSIAVLYWMAQAHTRPASILPESAREVAVDSTPTIATSSSQPQGGTFQTFEGVQMVLEEPLRPKAVLLLFHGCKHSSTDWWPKSDGCPACKGLPEETRITGAALAEGFAVVALSSQDRTHNRCWDTGWPLENTADVPKVTWALQALTKQRGWSELPMYALGASSGGALVLLLALKVPLQAICCQIMAIPGSLLQTSPGDESGRTWGYPRTAFTYMARDQHTARGVIEMQAVLTQQGVNVIDMEVQPRPLTPSFFFNRTQDISSSVSAAIFSTFEKSGLLDSSGFLLEDPRQTSAHWQELLKQHVPATKQMNLKVDESVIHEELNLAWAGHELISDNISSIFKFFQSR
ncbi:TPA: hypothetical protein ACH3X2_002029 [Trebouxia sp. C0005]